MSLHVQLTPEAQARLDSQRRNSTISSIIIAILVIVLIGLILALVLLPSIVKEIPVIVSYQGAAAPTENLEQKKAVPSMSRRPSAPSAAMSKVIAANTVSSLAVPVPDIDVTDISANFGTGDDFGDGWGGDGGGMGMGDGGGIVMFGKNLKVTSIGVVMDVSGSMAPHLASVVNEVNARAPGSPMILHPGCSVRPVTDSSKLKMLRVNAGKDQFRKSWYYYFDQITRSMTNDRQIFERTIPYSEVFDALRSRPETFFSQRADGKPAWGQSLSEVLTARELRNVEAIYWFADFQDEIDAEEAEKIVKALARRKQKLFLHASAKGNFLGAAVEKMALPTGGEQL